MSGGNDGSSMQNWPYPRVAGQDKAHFPLGTSPAKPAAGYFADVAGLTNEQVIRDKIAGLSSEQEIEDVLFKLFWDRAQARSFMWWRLKMRTMPRGPKGEKRPADAIGNAVMIAKIATGEIEETLTEDGKNAAAVALGRMGGKARAESMSAKRRKEIASNAAKSRWGK